MSSKDLNSQLQHCLNSLRTRCVLKESLISCSHRPEIVENQTQNLILWVAEWQCLPDLFEFGRQHIPHLGVTRAQLLNDLISCWFWVKPRTRKGPATRPGCSVTWATWQMQWCLKCQWHTDAFWSLCQAFTGRSYHGHLGFSNKALPPSADSYSPFQKQLLAHYWVSV